MPGLFFLASELGPSGVARTLARIATALASRYRVAVGVLGSCGPPFADELVRAGVVPVPLPVRGPFDLGGLVRARRQVRAFGPDVLHAVGPAAVRLASFLAHPEAARRTPRPVIASAADDLGGGWKGWWGRPMLRGADVVIATGQAEAERYRHLGVPVERVEVIPPGVSSAVSPPDPLEFRKALEIPSHARLVMAAGGFDAAEGLRSAVWAFDVVRYIVPDAYLVLIGDGPERGRTERFARGLAFDDFRVRFAGPRSDVPDLLALAEVAWVTHCRGGVNLALEAMAAGRPIVAFRTPDLAEVIEDGVTGRLVPPGERVELAAVTAELLADPALAGRLGAAGQVQTAGRHSVAEMIDRYVRLYERTVGG
jgi:glycosyltransferase involved in cell wall biosynthesis